MWLNNIDGDADAEGAGDLRDPLCVNDYFKYFSFGKSSLLMKP